MADDYLDSLEQAAQKVCLGIDRLSYLHKTRGLRAAEIEELEAIKVVAVQIQTSIGEALRHARN